MYKCAHCYELKTEGVFMPLVKFKGISDKPLPEKTETVWVCDGCQKRLKKPKKEE